MGWGQEVGGMCWFEICPRTGRHLRQLDRPDPGRPRGLYLHDLALDTFFDPLWDFQVFLAPHARPPFEDLISFVVDGKIPESMMPLVGVELARHHQAMQGFWAGWDRAEDGYPALLGRPMRRREKYWLVEPWVRRMAVGREEFYAGKEASRVEWLVNWRDWLHFDGRWGDRCWGRLRVFTDGTADAWSGGVGLLGFDAEGGARSMLGEAGFQAWEAIASWLGDECPPPPPAPPAAEADDPKGPFRYEGRH